MSADETCDYHMVLLILCLQRHLEASDLLSGIFLFIVSFCTVLHGEHWLSKTLLLICHIHMLTNWLLPVGANFEDMDNWMKRRFQIKKTTFQYIN